jgi:outer membrane receptor protein involved in Fe transport
VSYNRAFRAPSMINNNLDVTIGTPLPLIALNTAVQAATKVPGLFSATDIFFVPTRATGNPNLKEEHTDAFEVSFTGKVGAKSLFSAAWYYNKISDEIFFTVKSLYPTTAPPTGWTSIPKWAAFGPAGPIVAAGVWSGVQGATHFPSEYTYLNLGEVKQKGLELGFDSTPIPDVSFYINYSYQNDPVPSFPGLTPEQALAEINVPANNRFNAGVTATRNMVFATVDASYVGEAFWQDVLDSRYAGKTPEYTVVNLVAGARLNHDKATLQFRVNNLANKAIQQHIFGDVQKRSFMVELKINVPKKLVPKE